MLELKDIWFRYSKNSQWVLRGLTASFREGLNLVIGPNGSGKSTLLKVIVSFLKQEKGKILLNNKPIRKIDDVKGKMIYLPSNYLLYLTGPKVKDEIGDRMPELSDKRILELSEGEGRIVAIMSALLKDVDVILLDEPTIGLDKIKRRKIIELMREKKDKILIVASNDLRIVEYFDRVFLLYDGRIIKQGSPESVIYSDEMANILGKHPLAEFSDLTRRRFPKLGDLIKFLRDEIC